MSLPFVTDHAVLRYLERARGINVELIREHIALLCGPAAAVGAKKLRRDGVCYIIREGSVVTVSPDVPGQTATDKALGALQT